VLLDTLAPLQIEARYPDDEENGTVNLSAKYSMQLLIKSEEFLCWIKQQLEK